MPEDKANSLHIHGNQLEDLTQSRWQVRNGSQVLQVFDAILHRRERAESWSNSAQLVDIAFVRL
jgi:hypothetical protein